MYIFFKAKQFYIDNSYTLFKGSTKSFAQASFNILIEYVFIFSTMLSPTFIEKQRQIDPNCNFLQYISIHMISDQNSILLTQIFLGFNICIILAIQGYFIQYLLKPFKYKRGYLVILVANYNSILTIPFCIISVNQINIYSIINVALTILISLFCAVQRNNCFSYNQSDCFSKQGNTWDSIRPIFILVSLFSLAYVGNKFYCLFTFFYSVFNNLNLVSPNFYNNKSINKLIFFADSFITLISLITIFLSIFDINYSIILPLIIFPCLSYQIAQSVVEQLYSKIITKIQFIFENNINQALHIESDKLIDFYTRQLIDTLKTDEKKYLQTIHKQSLTFLTSMKDHKIISDKNELEQNKINLNNYKSVNLGQFLSNEDQNAFSSLKDQLRYLKQILEDWQKLSQEQDAEKQQQKMQITELFYLLQIEQNFAKLAIKIHQYIKSRGKILSLEEQSQISYIQNQLQQKCLGKIDKNQIEKAFEYEEEIENCLCSLKSVIEQKQKFLQNISKDNFDLEVIIKEGTQYLKMRNDITQLLLKLKATNDQNKEFIFLSNIYQNSIQIDPDDKRFLSQCKFDSLSDAKYLNRKQVNMEQAFKSSYLIIVSLVNNELGLVKKVSRNVKKLTGFEQSDMIGQNVNIQIPQSIAIHHNQIIRDSIERGNLTKYQMINAPQILRSKNRFGIKFQIIFQIQQFQSKDSINLIGSVKILNSIQKFVLVDVSQQKGHKIDIVSKQMWVEFFQLYFGNLRDVENAQIHQLIPTLTNIQSFLAKQNKQKISIQTLAFIPNFQNQREQYEKRFTDKCSKIEANVKKGYFNYDFNDVYLLDINVKFYSKEPFYKLLKIKFKSISKLLDKNIIENAIEVMLYPQWVDFGLISEDNLEEFSKNLKEDVIKIRPKILQLNETQHSTNYLAEKSLNLNQKNSPFSQLQICQLDQKQYPQEDSFMTIQQATDRFRKSMESDQTQASPTYKNALCISPNNVALLDQPALNEQKQTSIRKIEKIEQTLEILLSPAQSRYSQRVSMQDLLFKPGSNTKNQKDQVFPIETVLPDINLKQNSQASQTDQESEQDFEKSDGEQAKIKDMVQQGSVNNSNKSQNSALSQLKKNVIKKLLQKKSIKTVQMITLYLIISFLLIFITVVITHTDLNQKIAHQQISFDFSSWQDIYSTNLLQGLNGFQIYSIISLEKYTFSKYPPAQAMKWELKKSIQQVYEIQKANIINLINQDINQVFVKKELVENNIDFIYLTPTFHNITIQTSIFSSMIILMNFVPTLFMENQYGLIKELELMANAGGITQSLALVSKKQIDLEKQLNDNIMNSASLTLILVSTITAVMAIFVIPFYYLFQSRQEKVLRYFATIEPQSIAEMSEKLNKNLLILIKKQKSFNNYNIKAQKENQVISNQSKQNIKKKKKHISTTSLSKFNLKITFYAFLLLAAISVQPIVNFILTNLQIDQQTIITAFVRDLYQLKQQLYQVYYSLQLFSSKVANPYATLIPMEQIQGFLQTYVAQASQFGSTFYNDLSQVQSGNIFSDSNTMDTVKQILSQDACKVLKISQNFTMTYEQCSQIYSGAYNQGLVAAYSVFMLKIQTIYEISQNPINESTFKKIDDYFLENSILEDIAYFMIFEECINQLLNLINYQNYLFKKTIDYTQIFLFIFETCLLILLLPIVVIPFFNFINNRVNTIVQMFSIIQIKYILENSYLMYFIKQY